jgi:LPS-assembly protein
MAVSTTTRPIFHRHRKAGVFALALIALAIAAAWLDAREAVAQTPAYLGVPARRTSTAGADADLLNKRKSDPNAQMLVKADVLQYDYNNSLVSAVGHVQIYYNGSVIEADKVIYDQNTKRMRAEGNVRLTEKDGKVIYATSLDLNDDYRDGFVDSLRLDSPDKTRIAATRADRSSGNITVFQNSVYTACEACKDDPKKPPLWQIKGTRIVHDQDEKMIYYEGALIEFFGVPLAYVPYFSAPDPTVKRKSGFLFPTVVSNSNYGIGVSTPYYWALAPDYDMTLTPTITTKQGLLGQVEWRQRLVDGSYSIRGAGIFQLDKNQFLPEGLSGFNTGYRDFRGSITSSGQFNINEKWVWGWDAYLVTDKPFLQDYSVVRILPELVSQIYISGRGDTSYFDARSIYYLGLSGFDVQSQIPVIRPVIDYAYTFKNPVLGGELSYRFNLTSLQRGTADFDPITQAAANAGACEPSADPALKTRLNCLLRGVPGDYTRLSGEAQWRRTITDSIGQVWTPFVNVRGDAAQLSATNEAGVANYINTGDSTTFRAMPAVGVEYRYPFISVHSWGTQTIEPIAQVIIRPNETSIGKLPNEDSQSLVFSDANLFALNKFSGWDRDEGGSRVNYGLQYTAQFNRGGYVNVMVGQSYQLFGKNSYAVPDISNTGLDSGLDTRASDYVARLTFQPNSTFTFVSRFRFDEQTFAVRRLEFEGKVNFERWSASVTYGNYDAQPDIGLLTRRQAVLGAGSFKLTQNWSLTGSALYDLELDRFNSTSVGLGYIDDCFAMNVVYATNYGYALTASQPVHAIVLQISLRTLGGTQLSQSVDGLFSSTSGLSNTGPIAGPIH